FPFVALFSARVLIPFFRRGTITSAYGYLNARFGRSVSYYAAAVFLLIQVVRISSILFLISLIVQSVTGLPFFACLLLAGGITALYTVGGGFDAVIWTDVLQTLTLVTGAGILIGVAAFRTAGGLGQLLEVAWEHGKLSFLRDLNPDTGLLEPLAGGWSLEHKTFLMLLIVGIVQFMNAQFHQTTVQRWCSAKSAKESRRAIAVLGISAIPVWAGFMLVGTVLWAFFRLHPDPRVTEMLTGVRKAEEIVPYFLTRFVPAGWAGLVIAGAMAAAMSSLSSSINAAGMVWVRDIYAPGIARHKSDKHYLVVGFMASAAVSLLMLGGAWLFYSSSIKTLNEISILLANICGGGMLAVFLFGIFTRRGDSRAVWPALIANGVFVVWLVLSHREQAIPYSLPVSLYYSALIGNAVTFVVALLASLIFAAEKRDLTNLTVWDQESTPLV
ncbi:MAG: sodium transporter, partial [Lentisphaerae bacterium]|nr:sodium transporter [Lentisphaerota bacterium]